MSTAPQVPGQLKTYFWMVHYDVSPREEESPDGLKPIRVGRPRAIYVVHRNVYAKHVWGYTMAREGEGTPDPANFRGSPDLRNRIIGFYASAEEAKDHLTDQVWSDLQAKSGAIYAELHCMKLDIAQEESDVVRLVA